MPTSKYFKALSERGRKMARARWAKHEAKVQAEMPRRLYEIAKSEVTGERALRPGEYFGTIEYRDRFGTVHRITLRQGTRKNTLQIPGCKEEHGITWVLDRLRRKITTNPA